MKRRNPKKIYYLTAFFIFSLCLLFSTSFVWAAGLLTPQNSNLPDLEIKEHHVSVIVEDGYAITTVDQVFYNPNAMDLEAIYSFPVPEKGAVAEFTMWIDGQPINGEVLEKGQAREVYEDQKQKGNNAGLTEKDEYRTFDISVYPVRANQETKIRLSYMQPVHVDLGMGRYVYPLEEGGVDEQKLAFWTANDVVSGSFTFDLTLRSDYPVDAVRLPSHAAAQIAQNGEDWSVHLDNLITARTMPQQEVPALTINNVEDEMAPAQPQIDQNFRLDKDIVMYFRHADQLPGSVDLVAYKTADDKRGTFMLTVTPGMDLQPITEGRDWLFILDISGSMQGKYATLAEGVSRALESMLPQERFRIITFNTQASELTNGFVPATAENVALYIDKVRNIQPNNGTNLYAGLELGLKRLDSDRTSSLILVTDGVANVGVTQQKSFIELIKQYDIRLFTFIMGNSANQPLLDSMTKASHGFGLTVSNSDDIVGKILLAMNKVNFESLHGAQLKIQGVRTYDITPHKLGSLYRGQQLVVFGHYDRAGEATVSLEGKISGEKKVYQTTFRFPNVAEDNPEIERLWAYATIEHLTQQMEDFGEEADMKQAVIDLGTEYSLVTDYTSMVVVEEAVFQELGLERRNAQRLKTEYAARQTRASRPVQKRRVDTSQPMFNHNRPSTRAPSGGGGAGAVDPISILILLPFLRGLIQRRKS